MSNAWGIPEYYFKLEKTVIYGKVTSRCDLRDSATAYGGRRKPDHETASAPKEDATKTTSTRAKRLLD